MQADKSEPSWRLYERVVAAIEVENTSAGVNVSATMNAPIKGAISGVTRQIDLLIEARWEGGLQRRIIVDAKCYQRKLHVKDVESFEGMMKDCRAEHGIIVCPNGWSDAALRRSQDAITIKLLTHEDIEENSDWAGFIECVGCLADPDNKRNGIVLWDGHHSLAISGLWAIIFTGKCDVCHNFQVCCWDCGEVFSLQAEDSHECYCGYLWASAIEEEVDDSTGETLNAVHLLLIVDNELLALDRRSLR